MMDTVVIGCKLPHGLVLEVGTPGAADYRYVELNGVLKGISNGRKGSQIALTTVPLDIWNAWLEKNKTLRYVVEKSVFVA